ncbi:NAD(P)/FAD-dependent oxidoreductase [Bdellovibrio sp. SKB1291214]|uniref:NAD(P)-binding protein n=1 Tax=Bdellovibrio sp. SKB1291214 TaxID=1732569 RepID=UPI00223FB1D2|nr:FAD/NAD(P)-binding protein [Bdellovibrio sp. SKB1291214]UYL10663.1 NAD(P)/FAD-dependent oxidoreductase [Bdellovibrio sp. SKB1291214]
MAHIYDYAIIGSGLTGLSVAAALSRETKNVVLLDGLDHAFGANRQINFPTGPINNGIRFVPDSVLSEKALGFLENLLGQKVIADVSDEAPVTYDSGNFKTFLGFGENPPAFWEELSYFTSSKRIDLQLQPFQWTQMLLEKFTGEFMPRSYVTKFQQEGERITSVTVNGSKTVHAQNFIFAGAVRDLSLLLPEDAISQRARAKLGKNSYWTALCLDICHSKAVTESTAMHVLNGTTQDEIGPCAGRFMPAVEVDGNMIQASQWITFIETEVTDDSEVVGMTLKKIKRQIKRAYPEALDDVKLERIFVSPYIAGNGDLKLSANKTIPNLENLWVASAPLSEQKNLVGALLQAEMIVASLGFKVEEAAVSEAPAEEFSEATM